MTRVNVGPLGQARSTAPAHRNAQGWIQDGAFLDPIVVRRGRVTLAFELPLQVSPRGELQVRLGEGLALSGGRLVVDMTRLIGRNLELDVQGRVQVKQTPDLEDLSGLSISNPVSQTQGETIRDKITELIQLLRDGQFINQET